MHAEILASTAHVICVLHHADRSFYDTIKPYIQPLVNQDRVDIVVLGEHVRLAALKDVQAWAESEMLPGWERVKIGTMNPVNLYQTSFKTALK